MCRLWQPPLSIYHHLLAPHPSTSSLIIILHAHSTLLPSPIPSPPALTTLWIEPCFAAYSSQQPMERRTNYTCRDFTEVGREGGRKRRRLRRMRARVTPHLFRLVCERVVIRVPSPLPRSLPPSLQAYTICWDMSTQRNPFNWADELYRGYLHSLASYAQQHVCRGMELSASGRRRRKEGREGGREDAERERERQNACRRTCIWMHLADLSAFEVPSHPLPPSLPPSPPPRRRPDPPPGTIRQMGAIQVSG